MPAAAWCHERVSQVSVAFAVLALLTAGAWATNSSSSADAVDLSAAGAELGAEGAQLESLLHWAIGHSDPDALREAAEAAQRDGALADHLRRKRERVAELAHIVSQQPSETQLMMDDIALLQQQDAILEAKLAALAQLQALVEPIDNANGAAPQQRRALTKAGGALPASSARARPHAHAAPRAPAPRPPPPDLRVLGGLSPLVALLQGDAEPRLQEGAAYVLGTAASNNAGLVTALLAAAPGAPQLLLAIAAGRHDGAATKAMYALGCIMRAASHDTRRAFYQAAGPERLLALLLPAAGDSGSSSGSSSSSSACLRVRAKAATLLADLADMTEVTGEGADGSALLARFAEASLVALAQAGEAGKQALAAMQALLERQQHGREQRPPPPPDGGCSTAAGPACAAGAAAAGPESGGDGSGDSSSDGGGGGGAAVLALM